MPIKDKRFELRLSEKEKNELEKKAQIYDCSSAELIRRIVIENLKITSINIDMEPIKKMLAALTRQGGNLNQLMRFINTNNILPDTEKEVECLIKETVNVTKELRNMIEDIRKGELVR